MQKTAYEMRISDWSSDVCSSDLEALRFLELQGVIHLQLGRGGGPVVSRPQTRDFASSLSLILQFMDTDLRALLELREAIAPDMAARAAERATNAELAALSDCYAQRSAEHTSELQSLKRIS